MSIEKCSETTDSQDEAQLEQRGEVSAANSPNLVVFFRKGVGSMPARRDPLSSCSLISKALLEQKGCIDDIGQDDGTSDKCSHGARIGIFERSIERGDADIEVTFCVVEHEMIYPIIVGKDVQDVLDIPDVDATVAEGRPFGPLHLGRETEGKYTHVSRELDGH